MSAANDVALSFIRDKRDLIRTAAEYVAQEAYDSNGRRKESGTWDDDQLRTFLSRARSSIASSVDGDVAADAVTLIQRKIDRMARALVDESLARKAGRRE